MSINELIKRFSDIPLKDSKLLINRENEIYTLSKLAENYDNSIVGVTGARGSGKTTVLNLFEPKKNTVIKFIVRIEEKDTKLDIIASLLRGICQEIKKRQDFSKLKSEVENILNFLSYHEEKIQLISAGISYGAKLEKEKGTQKSLRYINATIKEKIESILKNITKVSRIALCIDEIDKEKTSEVVNIMDTLKGILRKENLVVFVSLPPKIYENYLKDEMLLREDYNLDDIFKKMVVLKNLPGENIIEIINTRLGKKFNSSISPKGKKMLVEYSLGNPRRAILPVYQALGVKTEKSLPVNENDILSEILPPLKMYIDSLKLTNAQVEILKISAIEIPNSVSKTELLDILINNGIKKSTAYDNIGKLITKEIFEDLGNNVCKLHSWVKIYYRGKKGR